MTEEEKKAGSQGSISFEAAAVLLDMSVEEIKELILKNAISYRKSGNSIFISRQGVEKNAEDLLQKRLRGMGEIINLQEEMGLYAN